MMPVLVSSSPQNDACPCFIVQDKLTWTLAWHEYRAALGGADYGREFNASLGFPLPGGLTGLVKLADYRSDGFARDTLKAWLQVEWSY